jgi:hypothetical protein
MVRLDMARWGRLIGLVGSLAILVQLGGCSESLPFSQLPDLTKLPQKVLGKDEQQEKINEMIENGRTHQTEAAKQIEKEK